jgi:hypothetical protein
MAAFLLTCSSFVFKITATHPSINSDMPLFSISHRKIIDFNVLRFSGKKVFLSWHTEGDSPQIVYEVLRKHNKLTQFVSLGVIEPKSEDESAADYSFLDDNSYSDSSYYCLKKTTPDSVIFYSITKGVAGVGRNR